MLNLFSIFLFLFMFCNNTLQQQKYSPPNNCSYLKYYYDGSKYFGRISLPDVGTSIDLSVHFSQRTPLAEDTAIKHLIQIESSEPYKFRMDFPSQNEMPKLTKLTLNNQDICLSNEYPAPSTSFSINYSIRPPILVQRPREPVTNNVATASPNRCCKRQQQRQPVTNNVATASPHRYSNNPFLQKTTTTPKKVPQVTSRQSVAAPSAVQYGQCGEENSLGEYIVGGDELKPGQFPWLAAIYHKKESNLIFLCGGSLISPRTVLTAGHCVKRNNLLPSQLLVLLGRHNLWDFANERYVTRNVEKFIVHRDYDPLNLKPDADLVIMHLHASVQYTNKIRPICLWTESSDKNDIVGQTGVVAGWGADGTGHSSTAIPKKVNTTIVSDTECIQSSSTYRSVLTDRTFCAGKRDGTGPCTGDSGSSLVLYRNGRWYLRGVVSTGQMQQHTCNLFHFVVFCDVAKHMEWVQSQMVS